MRTQNIFPLRGGGRNKERESWREVGTGREGEAERECGERGEMAKRGRIFTHLTVLLSCCLVTLGWANEAINSRRAETI